MVKPIILNGKGMVIMLDSNNTRRLCYLVKVDDIKPIEGRDRVECAGVSKF